MKKFVPLLTIICFFISAKNTQAQTSNKSFMHNNVLRTYEIYIPQNYTGTAAVPLIINYHGFTNTGPQQSVLANFQPIADSAGFIIVHPTGTLLGGFIPHWNVGGFTNGSTTDDVGFTSALIDTMAANYNINMMRVYACGFSNGGFFSHKLACELGHRIAAIASVAGTFTPQMQVDCKPTHPTPILQLHGTADPTVPYNGQTTNGVMASVDTVINYWVNYNNCNPTPTVTALPDINTIDGSTVERLEYAAGDAGVSVELLKITGGDHTWPGSIFGNKDINGSLEIWKFFSKYSNTAVGLNNVPKNNIDVQIFPNPSNSAITIVSEKNLSTEFKIFSVQGSLLQSGQLQGTTNTINVSALPNNIYLLQINNQLYRFIKTN